MRRLKRRLACLVVLASVSWSIEAHAPYERLCATVTDPAGRRLQVVAGYTDGIIGADPVTITVRDESGATIAETESARDAIVRCPTYASCRVFLYEPPFSLRPRLILRLESTGFVAEAANQQRVMGLLLPLWHHFPELLFESVALAMVPVLAQLLAWRPRTRLVVFAWVVFVPTGLAWISFLLLVVPLNTLVSVVWLVLGAGVLSVMPAIIRAASHRQPVTA
jgi:hypothetical protein